MLGEMSNSGQSSGATPAPPQPTSSHASAGPVHAAGANSGNLQFPTPQIPARKDEALQKAIRYVKELSEDDKEAFRSAPNIMERLQKVQENGKTLVSSSLTSRVEKVLQCLKSFMGSLAIFIGHSPMISSLVVGGVNCILMVGTSITDSLFI